MEVKDEPVPAPWSDWIHRSQPIGDHEPRMEWPLRQPGVPFDAPNKSREHLFAPLPPPQQEPFGSCWPQRPQPPAARAASTETEEDTESDRRGHHTPTCRKPSAATELWPSASPPTVARRRQSSTTTTGISSSSTASRLHPYRASPTSSVRSTGRNATAVSRPRLDESSPFSFLFSPPSTPRARGGDLRQPPFSATLSTKNAPPSSSFSNMMPVNVVPSVVLHFHGFRSSLLASLGDAALRIALDMAQRSLYFTFSAIAAYLFKMLLEAAVRQMLAIGLVSGAALCACEVLAVKYYNKRSTLLFGTAPTASLLAPSSSRADFPAVVPTLPRLNLPMSIAMLPNALAPDAETKHQQITGDAAQLAPPLSILKTPQPDRQLSAVRRRLVAQLRAPFPGVNVVPRERRRRADVALYDAKIRVGKAFLDPVVSAAIERGVGKSQKNVDKYMVRVDCSTPDDKHMNPVVMWDVTATFDEFRKLEKDLRVEIKSKRLRNVTVPHLSSGAILFVQPELTQDVLAKRRLRLQAFLDALRNDRVLADSDAMRKFCQAF